MYYIAFGIPYHTAQRRTLILIFQETKIRRPQNFQHKYFLLLFPVYASDGGGASVGQKLFTRFMSGGSTRVSQDL